MRTTLTILLIFVSFVLFGQGEQYKPTVAWKTNVENVQYLGVDTFKIDVFPLDQNEPGAGIIGNYLMDNIGHVFTIINSTSTTITVVDEFDYGIAPIQGKKGIVYKSVGDGDAPYIAPVLYESLDSKAKDNADRLFKDILWAELSSPFDSIFTDILHVDNSLWLPNLEVQQPDTLLTRIEGKVGYVLPSSISLTELDSTGFRITENQITDLDHFTGSDITGNETAFDGWDKNVSDDFSGNYQDLTSKPSFPDSISAYETIQNISTTGAAGNISISDGSTLNLNVDDADSDATNELQSLSIDSTINRVFTISQTDDGSVKFKDTDTQLSDSEVETIINNDADHGSTASHNYFTNADETDPFYTADSSEIVYFSDTTSLIVTRSYLEDYIHLESGRLEQLPGNNVSVTFLREFDSRPIGEEPQIYRWENFKGNYRRDKVLWGWADANQPTTTGFELNIDDSENLTNVIIEYAFVETLKEWILETGFWNMQGVWKMDEIWNF